MMEVHRSTHPGVSALEKYICCGSLLPAKELQKCSCRLASLLDMQVMALRSHLLHSAKLIEKTHAHQVPNAGPASRDPSVPTSQEWIQEGIRLGNLGGTLDEQLRVRPLCMLGCDLEPHTVP